VGFVSATPTVVGNVVYAQDWSGHLYAIDAPTGKTIWSHQIAEYDGISGSVSRTSPAFYKIQLILGNHFAFRRAFPVASIDQTRKRLSRPNEDSAGHGCGAKKV
jgi:hypothetical protein